MASSFSIRDLPVESVFAEFLKTKGVSDFGILEFPPMDMDALEQVLMRFGGPFPQ